MSKEPNLSENDLFKMNSSPIGEKNKRADIGLVGVDASVRGKGIASKLLKCAEQFARKHTYNEMQVVTQIQNEPACKLYEKYGFKKDSVVNIFHVWKKGL